ncbi:MBOAT family protein [Microbacterium sp. ANT_H45B]|uniref:MBOAT family O-acyltransferase n=1 Tax=Microbacterium sp. ANT_H45B TaxID=2597346 RepID=UPI0011EDD4C8|nr:MBOAT family O-acyltransferase [Microbacterium sp. ANT_H45B]KAA0962704.1 MBOAT family protein [Microbacterium sp. ANT_H45B]
MVFSSPTFLFLFLPLTMLGYHLLPVRGRSRNWWLLAMSIVFYYWGAGSAIGAILWVSIFSFGAAWAMWRYARRRHATGRAPLARVPLAVALAIVLVPLVLFKYLPQLAIQGVPGAVHIAALTGAESWILPLGVSFFTFHGISYVIDSYRNGAPLTRSFPAYLLYLFVFPHQIAGPIVRYAEIKDEVESSRTITASRFGYGATRFAWGLAKKVLIADSAGQLANAMFDSAAFSGQLSMPTAWIGAVAYAVQIYFDFSGYSDMAIGLAAMFGFHFPENFRSPYTSHSVSEFWRRWHITLTRWFRDYVYIPMGGNRKGRLVEYGALLTVFTLTSIWHGALAGFLVWGGLQAAAMLFERATGLRDSRRFLVARRILTAFFVILAWVPFRTTELDATGRIWRAMFTGPTDFIAPQLITAITPFTLAALLIGLLAFFTTSKNTAFEILFRPSLRDQTVSAVRGWVIAAPLFVVTIAMVLLSDFSPFLYFQF